MSNYPPGVTGAVHLSGAARFVCPAHGTNYGYAWRELGGFFVDSETPRGIDEFAHDNSTACPDDCAYMDAAQWEEDVEAARCTTIVLQARNPHDNVIEHTVMCGAWTECVIEWDDRDLSGAGDIVRTTLWLCPRGHEFETEEAM